MIIAIDGPAASGKSTVAKAVAHALNFAYLDTGAMYRAVTLKALQQGVELDDPSSLARLARETQIRFQAGQTDEQRVIIDDEDVTEAIREQRVTNNVSVVSKAASLRRIMVANQRKLAQGRDVVVEGRDIGTVVFPHAEIKVYLGGSLAERSCRRRLELQSKGQTLNQRDMERKLENRDRIDSTRTEGPLEKADDAIEIDTTNKTVDEVIEEVVNIAREKITA